MHDLQSLSAASLLFGGVLFLFVVFFLLLLLGFAIQFWLLARANTHVRNDLPTASPRRESLLRWNFWTLGTAAVGSLIRVAISTPDGMNSLSYDLRTWARTLLGRTLGLTVLGLVLASLAPTLGGLAYIALAGVAIHAFRKLSRDTELTHPALSSAAKKGLSLLFYGLGLFIVGGFLAGLLAAASAKALASILIALAIVVGYVLILRAGIHLTRTWLLIGIATTEASETTDTRTGGRDAAIGFVAYIAWAVVFGIIAGIQAVLTKAN